MIQPSTHFITAIPSPTEFF